MQNQDGRPFQILALAGGGFRGLYTAKVLADLEQYTGNHIAKHFDLLAGTSVGGIIALAAACEIPMDRVVNLFEKEGKKIFKKRPFFSRWWGVTKSPYDSSGLRELIQDDELFGDLKLSDAKHPVLVPAINYTKGGPQVFKTPHHHTFQRDHIISLVDVALATSAAPAYFQRHCFNDWQFADGGLCANNPALLALHEADYFFDVHLKDIRLLSIGTLSAQRTVNPKTSRDGGAIDWAESNVKLGDFPKNIIDLTLSSQQQLMEQMAIHRLIKHQGVFLKIDEKLTGNSVQHIGLDQVDAAAIEILRGNASLSTQVAISKPEFIELFRHLAEQPKWFHGPHTNVSI